MTEKPLTRTELAELTGLHPRTIDKRRKQGMPFVLYGARTPRFYASECLPWLAHFGRTEHDKRPSGAESA
jgi:phage terminase Nu1 subunit (DNA packaging protein)